MVDPRAAETFPATVSARSIIAGILKEFGPDAEKIIHRIGKGIDKGAKQGNELPVTAELFRKWRNKVMEKVLIISLGESSNEGNMCIVKVGFKDSDYGGYRNINPRDGKNYEMCLEQSSVMIQELLSPETALQRICESRSVILPINSLSSRFGKGEEKLFELLIEKVKGFAKSKTTTLELMRCLVVLASPFGLLHRPNEVIVAASDLYLDASEEIRALIRTMVFDNLSKKNTHLLEKKLEKIPRNAEKIKNTFPSTSKVVVNAHWSNKKDPHSLQADNMSKEEAELLVRRLEEMRSKGSIYFQRVTLYDNAPKKKLEKNTDYGVRVYIRYPY